MNVVVLHKVWERGYEFSADSKDIAKNEYKMVAHVKVDTKDIQKTLGIVWEKTNNITHSWLENKEVTSTESEARSSSVGDIFVVDGKQFIVAPIGFEPVESTIFLK